jgi:hypothetical protein
MGTRWWQHDDRTGGEAPRTAYNSGYGRQPEPAQQQYGAQQQQYGAQQQQPALRADAEPFKPQVSAQGPAPGFNRAAPTANKAALPKVWEYEDPLKDVHGPFDAAQIINWFAQVRLSLLQCLQDACDHVARTLHTCRTAQQDAGCVDQAMDGDRQLSMLQRWAMSTIYSRQI